jgi:hypothetical protein
MVSLILERKRPLLNTELIVINVLNSLTPNISMCSPHITSLSEITQIYISLLEKVINLPLN